MTITVSERWKNPDGTLDLNKPVKNLVAKGFVWGGTVAPTGTGLFVTIDPFAAFTADGMVGLSDAVETLPIVAGQISVVVFLAKYNAAGSPSVPTANLQVLEVSVYNAHADKAYMNEFCRIDLAPAAVNIVAGDIDFTQRHEVDQVGRSVFRGIVTFANLPVPASPTNRVGDFFWVSDRSVFYFWAATLSWEALNTGSFNAETNLLNDQLETRQRNRLGDGSGIVAGTRPGDGSFAAYPEVTPIETPSVANSIDIDAFSAVINGHFVETYARSYTLGATADRLDLIFLEIWREVIATPNSLQYGLNPDGSSTVNIEGVDDIEETLTWQKGLAGNNYDFYKLEVYNHAWRVIKVRFAHLSSCPTIALVNPVHTTVATAATNIDGNPFVAPTGTQSDDRVWKATSTTGVDGWSWAIPLFVIKRTVAENPGIADAIKIFRSGERHVFPVYPVADVDVAAKDVIDTVDEKEPVSSLDATKVVYDQPSGFLNTFDYPIRAGIGANTIRLYAERVKVRIRGHEEWLEFASPSFSVGTPPVLGWERILVVLTHKVTLYDNDPTTKANFTLGHHRPFLKSTIAGTVRGMGYKRGYLNYEVEILNLGATDVLDENDAMVAAGWARGDLAAPAWYSWDDGGLWSRVSPTGTYADPEGNPYGVEWAIPICLIHRRNSTAYDRDTNTNGSGSSRPDDRTDATIIHADDLVPLRHRVGLTTEELPAYLDQQMDLLNKGQLRTRMANKYLGAGGAGVVAGSRILQADIIGTTTGGPWPLTAGDSSKRIWSDSREYQLISVKFDITGAPVSTAQYDYTYAGSPPDQGVLVVKAPSGSFLVRHLPGFAYVDGDKTSPDYLQFYGPPCWSTQQDVPVNVDTFPLGLFAQTPSPCKAKYIDATSVEGNLPFYEYGSTTASAGEVEPFAVIATDSMGRATEMEGHVDTTGITGLAVLSWWVCYDRSFATLDNYDDNYGLAEVPDTVWKVTRDPGVTDVDVNVGAIYTNVQKVAVASSTIVITAADVTAASGLPGVVRLVGLDYREINWSPTIPTISSITLEDINQDDITINLTAPWTGTVEIIIYFETADVDTWVEIGRGGKSVQGIFFWLEQDIDLTGTPPPVFSESLGYTSFVPVQIGGEMDRATPILWSRISNVPGNRWVLGDSIISGYAYSNLLSFDTGALDRYVKVVVCGLEALGSAPADRLVIEYTYTPYQGQSTPSGATPIPATALLTLKSMLHGEIEQVSDWYASQSGPASYHSGIETWSGIPINQVHPSYQANYLTPLSRFDVYNRTALVVSKPVSGFSDRSGLYQHPEAYNAASLFRLPFPQNPAMVTSFSWYHDGVMEFDLDPCRAGAGAGVLSYAPGYWGGACTNKDHIRYDQFDNGLTPFSLRGGVVERADNLILLVDEYNAYNSTAAYSLDGTKIYFTQGASDRLFIHANLHVETNSLIKRIQHHIEAEREPGSGGDPGMLIYLINDRDFLASATATDLGFWTVDRAGAMVASYIPGFVPTSLKEVILSIHPGAIHSYAMLSQGHLSCQTLLHNSLAPNVGEDGAMYHTGIFAEALYTRDHSRVAADFLAGDLQSGLVDIVKIPWSSQSSTSHALGHQSTSGFQNLKGTSIVYPTGWSAGDITALEALFQGSQDGHGRGRGLYLGSASRRYTMPVLLPGSGNSLKDISFLEEVSLTQGAEDVPHFPVRPGEPLFGENNRSYMAYSHGGPIAYVYVGMFVNPGSPVHFNQLVLQVSGGPTGPNRVLYTVREGSNSVYGIDGTAIDAFWPTGRPLLASKR